MITRHRFSTFIAIALIIAYDRLSLSQINALF